MIDWIMFGAKVTLIFIKRILTFHLAEEKEFNR